MTKTFRSLSAAAVLSGMLLTVSPAGAVTDPGTGRMEGRVRRPDGRPAAGYGVVLVDGQGGTAARAGTSKEGAFLFAALPAGAYQIEVVDGAGQVAPVAGPATTVPAGSTVRRDLKLVHVDGTGPFARRTFGPNADSWWDRRTRNQKILTIVGIAVGAGVVLAVANSLSDDDQEPQASASRP